MSCCPYLLHSPTVTLQTLIFHTSFRFLYFWSSFFCFSSCPSSTSSTGQLQGNRLKKNFSTSSPLSFLSGNKSTFFCDLKKKKVCRQEIMSSNRNGVKKSSQKKRRKDEVDSEEADTESNNTEHVERSERVARTETRHRAASTYRLKSLKKGVEYCGWIIDEELKSHDKNVARYLVHDVSNRHWVIQLNKTPSEGSFTFESSVRQGAIAVALVHTNIVQTYVARFDCESRVTDISRSLVQVQEVTQGDTLWDWLLHHPVPDALTVMEPRAELDIHASPFSFEQWQQRVIEELEPCAFRIYTEKYHTAYKKDRGGSRQSRIENRTTSIAIKNKRKRRQKKAKEVRFFPHGCRCWNKQPPQSHRYRSNKRRHAHIHKVRSRKLKNKKVKKTLSLSTKLMNECFDTYRNKERAPTHSLCSQYYPSSVVHTRRGTDTV